MRTTLTWKAWSWDEEAVRDTPLVVNGTEVRLDPSGVLLVPAARLLVVADLHFEKASAYARRGQFLPPYDTALTLACLENAVHRHRPRTVIALGDSFHDRWGPERMDPTLKSRLSALMTGRRFVWIAGNHDPEPPAGLGGESAPEAHFGGLSFRHEPTAGAGPGEVAGHLHPAAKIVVAGRGVRRRCFLASPTRLVLPAFGALTGGLNVLDRAFAPLFPDRDARAFLLADKRVVAVAPAALRGD